MLLALLDRGFAVNPIDSPDPSSTGKNSSPEISSAPKVNAPTPSHESSTASPNDASQSSGTQSPAGADVASISSSSSGATEGSSQASSATEGAPSEASASGEGQAAAEGQAAGSPEKKKRRRRRRKKSGAHAGQPGDAAKAASGEGSDEEGEEESEAAEGASAEGAGAAGAEGEKAEGAAAEGGDKSDKKDKKKKKPKKDRPAKETRERPAFGVGEVVFGKILEVGEDAIFVDLSGKARAIFDKLELLLPEDVADQVEDEARRAEARAEAIITGRDPDAAEAAAAANHAKETAAKAGQEQQAEAQAEVASEAPAEVVVTNGSTEVAVPAEQGSGASLDGAHRRIVQPRLRSEPPEGAEAAAEEAPVNGQVEGAPVEAAAPAEATQAEGEAAPAAGEAAAEVPDAAPSEPAEPLPAGVVQLPRVVLEPGAPFVGVVHNDGGRGGLVVLTHHPRRASKAKPQVAAAFKQKTEIFGLVSGVIKGGVEVDVDGVRAFAPGSHMDLRLGADLHPLVGKRLPFFVTQYGKRGRDVVLSRRALLEAEAKVARESALAKIQPGSTVTGVVRSVVQFGAFIDIGGVEGLVPLTEMSHNRGDTPSDVFKVGATVDVKILRVDEKGKVWLSRKATISDPWLAVAEKYAFGSRHTGKVVRLQPFGAFIELEPGVDGLIHTADLAIKRIEHPSEVVTVGDPIEVVVASLDPGSHRIGLHPAPTGAAADEAPQRVQLHKVVKVQVVSIETGGLTVRVLGATGRHARGFIPAGGTGTPRGTDLRKAFPPGHTLDAKVIEMDPKRSEIKLSIRAMQEENERSAYQQYRQQVKREAKFGTFADLLAKRGPTQK